MTLFRTAAILFALFSAQGLHAQSLGFIMPGATDPGYVKSKWVKGPDQAVLKRYAQSKITHITFHHEGFANSDPAVFAKYAPGRLRQSTVQRARNIHNFHVDSGLGMIAYNFVVGVQGDIALASPLSFAPATFTKDPATGKTADFTGHFAVVMLGDFGVEPLSQEMRLGLVKVMSEGQRYFRVPTANIEPHKDHVSHNGRFGTQCPGKHVYDQKDRIANMTLAVSLQTELAQRGCYTAGIDGEFGDGSQAALQTLAGHNPKLGKLAPTDETLWAMLDAPQAVCR
jgi:hypothetical protein